MSRDYKVYLEDILLATDKVAEFTSGLSQEEFVNDAKTFDAVLRNLEVIGEAAKAVPEEIRLKSPELEWKRIAGLRDILAHHYFAVDPDIIWDIVQNKLPPLRSHVERLLQS